MWQDFCQITKHHIHTPGDDFRNGGRPTTKGHMHHANARHIGELRSPKLIGTANARRPIGELVRIGTSVINYLLHGGEGCFGGNVEQIIQASDDDALRQIPIRVEIQRNPRHDHGSGCNAHGLQQQRITIRPRGGDRGRPAAAAARGAGIDDAAALEEEDDDAALISPRQSRRVLDEARAQMAELAAEAAGGALGTEDFVEREAVGGDEVEVTRLRGGRERSIGQALKGAELGAFWKYRVGDYRIISSIEDRALRILVVRVGNLCEVYR